MSIHDVRKFHERFGLPLGEADVLIGHDKAEDFRLKFLQEELNEFDDAIINRDRVKAFDALLDLVYVAYGTALFMGVSPDQWDAGFQAVQDANMAKIRVASGEDSKRGSSFDVVKPAGWVGPEMQLKAILDQEKP